MVVSVLGAKGFLWSMMVAGPNSNKLFFFLFIAHFFNFAAVCLTAGTICAESVPVKLMATATGLVSGVGEIFGGAAAPALAGFVAKQYGIQYILHLAMGTSMVGLRRFTLHQCRQATKKPPETLTTRKSCDVVACAYRTR